MPKPILIDTFTGGGVLAGHVADLGGTWRIATTTDGAYGSNGGDTGVLTTGGRLRPAAGSSSSFNTTYINSTQSIGICQDIYFDAFCATKAGSIFVGMNHYPPFVGSGTTVYQQVGVSIDQNNADPGFIFTSALGPAFPFGTGFFRPSVNAATGITYKIHVASRPEATFISVNGLLVATTYGLNFLGITAANKGNLIITVPSTALVPDDVSGWQIDNLQWYSYDPYPTVKSLSTPLGAHLAGELQTKAMLVKLVREDGVVFGFTTHDVPITIAGVLYESIDGTAATAMRIEAGTGVDSMDITGVLTSDRIIEDDVRAGKYDNAAITVYECNWGDLTQGTVTLGRGLVGDITISDGKFLTSFRSLTQRMQQQIGRIYSPNCDVKSLGDTRCKVNLAGNTADGYNITATGWLGHIYNETNVRLSNNADEEGNGTNVGPGNIVFNAGFYTYGTMRIDSGPNAGIIRPVLAHTYGIQQAPQQVVQVYGSSSALSFSNNPTATGTTSSVGFLVQPGNYTSAYLEIRSRWSTHSGVTAGQETPGELAVEVPIGLSQRVVVRQVTASGDYIDFVDFTDTAMIFLNGLLTPSTSGTLNCGFRFQSQTSNALRGFDVTLTSIVLYLTGSSSNIGSSYEIVLGEAFPFPVARNTGVTMVAGCNRLITQCRQKFNNIANNRSFPTIPGNSILLAKGRPPG